MMTRPVAVLSLFLLAMFASAAQAADIYRWVDDKGQTHVADTVPPQYQQRATRIDTSRSEINERDRAEAAARADADRQKAAIAGTPGAGPSTSGATPPDIKPGASGLGDKQARCAQRRQAYEDSQSCFNQYRVANGSVRSEAYQNCTEVPDPAAECGAPTN
jgi:hypothetical protein